MEELSLLSKRIQITEETMRDLRIELVNAENRLSSCNNKSSEKGASGETDKAKTESERLESNLPAHVSLSLQIRLENFDLTQVTRAVLPIPCRRRLSARNPLWMNNYAKLKLSKIKGSI